MIIKNNRIDVVISIDKDAFDRIRNDAMTNGDEVRMAISVCSGKPLPKGHGNLIDASEKVTMQIFDDEYEEISEKTMTIEDSLALYADGGYTTIIEADKESEE